MKCVLMLVILDKNSDLTEIRGSITASKWIVSNKCVLPQHNSRDVRVVIDDQQRIGFGDDLIVD